VKKSGPGCVHGIVDTLNGAIARTNGRAPRGALVLLVTVALAPAARADDRSIGERLTTPTIEVTTKPYPGTSVEWGRAVGVIDAPADKVLAIVHDYGRYATFLPHFESSRVLSQRGTSALVYLEAKIIKRMVTVWAEMKLSSRKVEGGTHVVEGDMKKGNVDVMSARWEVTPIDANRTKVAFQLIMDPGVPMPSSTITYFGAKATRQTLEALQKRLVAAK
jgi:ribosome-associated toxin RatA of RatAB toxin-antitoxin module